jgi:phage FluMu gp28-like protein
LRGHEATHIIVDEAAYIAPSVIEDALWPMMATTDGQMTLISTPKGHNAFFKFYERARDDEDYFARRSPSDENPYVSKRFLESQRLLTSERTFQVEYEAEFMDDEGTVFRSEAIESCLTPTIEDPRGTILIGIDFARYCDYTVLTVLQGNRTRVQLLEMKRLHQIGWEQQLDILEPVIRRYPGAHITCDSTGVGDPIVDSLTKRLPTFGVRRFKFDQKSKSELIDNLVAIMESGVLRITPNEILLRELKAFRYNNGKMEGAGEKDDCVISLALAAFELPREDRVPVLVGSPRIL